MAHIVKCFKSGNTLRVTLNSSLRFALCATPGDYLKFDDSRKDGVFVVTNLTERERTERSKKK